MPANRSELVGNRIDLAQMLNDMGLVHEAVEVGTHKGVFAAEFLSVWKGGMLFCVDLWEPYEEMFWDRAGDLGFAIANLAKYSSRCQLVKAGSSEAAFRLNQPKQFGFVYIDGAHDHDSVVVDLEAWWPRVSAPGCLAGHDYDVPDVAKAVNRFARTVGATVQRTSDFYSPSWFIIKDRAE